MSLIEKFKNKVGSKTNLFLRDRNPQGNWTGIFANGLRTEDGDYGVTAEMIREYHTNGEVIKSRTDNKGNPYPTLVERLIAIDKELEADGVSVKRYGAKGDGRTDDTCAFEDAFADGVKWLKIPAGTYIVRGINVPSNTKVTGQGASTILKLHKNASASNVIQTWSKNNVILRDFAVDGNNLKDFNMQIGHDPRSNGVAIVDSSYVWVQNVSTKDTGKHGFDISSPNYAGSPDNATTYAPNGSKYVWIDNCTATTFGDDGFTTHFSEYVFFTNCQAHSPSTTIFEKGRANTNGFEADDGSKHIWFLQCHSRRNCRGFEVKGHATRPAAQNVHLVGCTSNNDIRSFDFRHIGHHGASNPTSKTAYNITCTDCTAIRPMWNKDIYDLSPRALTVSAFRNVSISNFSAIGDPDYNYSEMSGVVVMQFKTRNVTLQGINISGFKNVGADIRITGGLQFADNINISNVNIFNSSRNFGIYTGGRMNNINISNVNMTGDGNNNLGISTFNSRANLNSIKTTGYKNAASIGGKTYKDFVPNSFTGGTRIAAPGTVANHYYSAIVASTAGATASGHKSFIAASSSAKASGERTAAIATSGSCEVKGDRNLISASTGGSSTDGSRSTILSANNSHIPKDSIARMVLSSNGVINDTNYNVMGGYGQGDASAGNVNWSISSMSGNAKFNRIEGSTSNSDFAEYFESSTGQAIETGLIVKQENGKVRLANSADKQLAGVVSETAALSLGDASLHWQGKYKRNEFGGLLFERVWDDEDQAYHTLPIKDDNYDESKKYTPRSQRKEWISVGLTGQVFIRVDETVKPNDIIKSNDYGIGTKSDSDYGWEAMIITKPYDSNKGYGIAKVLIR